MKPKNKKQGINTAPSTVANAQGADVAVDKEKKSLDVNPLTFDKLKIISIIVLIGFVASYLFHYYISLSPGKDVYPFNTFLYNPADRYNDFYNIFNASAELNPYIYPVSVYFPFTYVLMHFLNGMEPGSALSVFNISFTAFLLIYMFRALPVKSIIVKILAAIVISVLSYPYLFVVDRGNLEAWVFIFSGLFIFFYLRKKDLPAMIFLSMAVAIKLYPAILALLFLLDRKYLKVLYTALMSVGLTIVSAALLEGGVMESINGQLRCLDSFSKSYISGGTHGLQHSTSLFAPVKLLYYNILTKLPEYPAGYEQAFNSNYFIGAMLIFLFIAFVVLRYKMALWKIVALLVFTFTILPQVSYDYKLIDIFIPLGLYFKSEEKSPFNKIYSVFFGLFLIPKDYVLIVNDLSIASIINPLLILSMIILIIVEAVKSGITIKWAGSGA